MPRTRNLLPLLIAAVVGAVALSLVALPALVQVAVQASAQAAHSRGNLALMRSFGPDARPVAESTGFMPGRGRPNLSPASVPVVTLPEPPAEGPDPATRLGVAELFPQLSGTWVARDSVWAVFTYSSGGEATVSYGHTRGDFTVEGVVTGFNRVSDTEAVLTLTVPGNEASETEPARSERSEVVRVKTGQLSDGQLYLEIAGLGPGGWLTYELNTQWAPGEPFPQPRRWAPPRPVYQAEEQPQHHDS